MDLRPVIYVKRITNLSDARYCAAMGADMLGVLVTPHHEDYVSPSQFKEIMDWVSGPQRVIEITDETLVDWQALINDYSPDLIHLSGQVEIPPDFPDIPLIVDVNFKNLPRLQAQSSIIRFITVPAYDDNPESLNEFKPINLPILIPLKENPHSLAEVQLKSGAAGFILEGSRELSPGFKDYDHLSQILEALDL